MDDAQVKVQMNALIEQIEHHNRLYYGQDNPEISDYEYDLLFAQLKELEERYPHLARKDSPTKSVGFSPSKRFQEFTHPTPMLSLNNVMNEDEFLSFYQKLLENLKVPWACFVGSLKYDGLAIELIYENGQLEIGATRGNGFVGENITANVRRIATIPKSLSNKFPRLILRGEVVMLKEEFKKINEERGEKGLPLFSNTRNAAAGTLRQLDDEVVRERNLLFIAYQLANATEIEKHLNVPLDTYYGQLEFLDTLGFSLHPHTQRLETLDDILKHYRLCEGIRKDLPYNADGVVYRCDDIAHQNTLGEVARRPRYSIAWKFPPYVAQTRLLKVQFQVGRTGILTPVGVLEPVSIEGAIVRKVTLHNMDEIKRKDLMLGDSVRVIRSGDVIPKIVSVIKEKRDGGQIPVGVPTHCPSCGFYLEKVNDGGTTLLYCKNSRCPEQQIQRILHFISKENLDVDGWDEKIIQELFAIGLVKDPSDLYTLSDDDLKKVSRMGEKRQDNLRQALERSKKTTLPRFINGLGIRGVGLKTATLLADKFKSLGSLMEATREAIVTVDGIGEKTAEDIAAFFNHEDNRNLIRRLLSLGIQPEYVVKENKGPLAGLKVLFTGTLPIPRNIAKSHIERLGGECVGSLTQDVSLLIVGENPGSKLKKATEMGIEIMDEAGFLKLVQS